MKKQNKQGKAFAICGIATGWFIPLLGIILGIIAKSKATSDEVQTLGTIAICESIAFWILWTIKLL